MWSGDRCPPKRYPRSGINKGRSSELQGEVDRVECGVVPAGPRRVSGQANPWMPLPAQRTNSIGNWPANPEDGSSLTGCFDRGCQARGHHI